MYRPAGLVRALAPQRRLRAMKRSTVLLLALNAVTFVWIYHLKTKDEDGATTPEIELAELLGDPKRITIERGFPVGSRHTLSNEEDSCGERYS